MPAVSVMMRLLIVVSGSYTGTAAFATAKYKKDDEAKALQNDENWLHAARFKGFSGESGSAVSAERPQRQLSERVSATFAFAAKRDDTWSKKIYERK
jgi:hypothetical protein